MEKPRLIEHKTYEDTRGVFCPSPLNMNYDNDLNKNWVQVNTSVSPDKFTIRGLHYQEKPFEQTKYLKVIYGKIKTMIICVDQTRDDFGEIFVFNVDRNQSVFVPRGYANGLITMEKNTVIQYFVDNPYSPKHEKSMLYSSVEYFDKMVKKLTKKPSISEKDLNGFLFSDLPIFK